MVRLKVEVVMELVEERAHREVEPTLQVVDKDNHHTAAGVQPDLVLGGVRTSMSASMPSTPVSRSAATVSAVTMEPLQLEVEPTRARGAAAWVGGVPKQGRRARASPTMSGRRKGEGRAAAAAGRAPRT